MGTKQIVLVTCMTLGAWLPSRAEPAPEGLGPTTSGRGRKQDTLVTREAGGTPAVGESLSLRSAIQLALNHNPGLQATGWELQRAEARKQQARLLPNPEVEIEVENIATTDGTSGFDAAETTLALAQEIELGGKRAGRTRVAKAELELVEWDRARLRADVVLNTTRAFTNVLASQERVRLLAESCELAERIVAAVSERVNSGKVSPLELTKAKVALASRNVQRRRAVSDLHATRVTLAAMWGSLEPAFEDVVGEWDALPRVPPCAEFLSRIGNNPDVARWRSEAELRRAIVGAETAERTPNITLSAGVTHLGESGDQVLKFALAVPLPFSDRNQGRIREAQAGLSKALEEQRAVSVKTEAVLIASHRALTGSYEEALSLKEDVLPAAQEAFEAAQVGYEMGKFGYLDVLDAQQTLFELRMQDVDALAAYHLALAEARRLVGEELQ